MLNELLPRLQERLADWSDQLIRDKWIGEKDKQELLSLDTHSPAELFNNEERPLVVAFFGGTGVGKSSLLNRLADEAIARTGVERPTSREVTLYLHQSVSIDNLPEAFPTEEIKLALHRNENNRDLLWIDMPDFDSVEQSNKDIVIRWLPYIDVLLYVVSPERYKDDKGWRLLLEHGENHAWVFVINHWDRGEEEQYEDFSGLLSKAGLSNPLIFRTNSCPDTNHSTKDDFQALESTIQNLADDKIIKHLEERGINLRVQELQRRTHKIVSKIGSSNNLEVLASDWQSIWDDTQKSIHSAQQMQISRLSDRFATAESRWLNSLFSAIRSREPADDSSYTAIQAEELWDAQVADLASDGLEKLVHRARLREFAAGPIQVSTANLQKTMLSDFSRHLQECLHDSLKTPGSRWHRFFHRILGVASSLLPLAAMCWVAYKVVTGFYLGNIEGYDYLGMNFAIHSVLLIGLAWLVPWFVYQKTKPSRQQAAQIGMQNATRKTLRQINTNVLETFELIRKRQERAVTESRHLFSHNLLPEHYSRSHKEKILDRLLIVSPNDVA